MRALLLALALLAPALAHGAQLFVSTEHPFAPDTPGAVVKLEVPVARSVDVRLYRLDDPERFFAAQSDLRHVATPDLFAEPGKKGEAAHRAKAPLSLVRGALAQAAQDGKSALQRGLSPVARSLFATAVQAPTFSGPQALPFLRGLELVERWGLACGTGEDEFSYCDLDLGPRPAGAYLVEAVAGREVAHAVALFSHLALLARRTEGHVAILAVDGKTGAALPNVHVAILEQGVPTLHGTTTRAGLYLSKVPARPVRVFGQLGLDAAVLELLPVTAADTERGTLLLTDRGEYRPGEKAFFHGFARTPEDRLAPPRGDRVEISAYDARGSLFESAEYALSAQGGFGGEIALPPGLPQGLYRIVATLAGHSAGAEFAVREAPAPAFQLEATLSASTAGSPARASLKASADGRPLPEVHLSWRAVREQLGDEGLGSPEEVERGEATADADGAASLSFDTLGRADARYVIEAVARDGSGRLAVARASAMVVRSPLRVLVTPEHRVVPPGSPVTVAIAARGEGDQPLAIDLKIRVQAARSGAAGEGSRDKVLTQELKTGADGKATLSFTPTSTGYYEIEASHQGARLSESFLYVTAEGGDIPFSPDALVLVPDKPAYTVGETARVLVLAPFDAATALMTVEGTDLIRHDALPIRGASAVWSVRVLPGLAPDFTISAQAVFNERAWRTERVLHVVPRGEPLSVRAALSAAPPPSPGGVRLEVEVLDKAGRPIAGAELFAVVRDARSVEASAPPILAFFHPTRLSDGATASSTGYRNSSSGRTLRRAAFEAVDEGYLPFKGLAQGRPRPRDEGTLLALSATTDAHGKASFAFVAPADVARVAASARAVFGAAMGEWSGSLDRGLPGLSLAAPRFLRMGDEAKVAARAPESAHALNVELSCDGAVAHGSGSAALPLSADLKERTVLARLEGQGTVLRKVVPAPDAESERRGLSGVAGPGRAALSVPEGARPAALYLCASPLAAVVTARAAMGEGAEPMTERRVARLLTRLAEWRARTEPGAELRAAALTDIAALAGFAHPEGSFGPYDGGPADLELTADALLALALARDEGLEVEDGVLTRGATRLLAIKHRGALASLVLTLLEEAPEGSLEPLLAAERAGGLGAADRALVAWALDASQEKESAREVALRLERSARLVGPLACFADSCPADASRATIRATALAVLTLRRLVPRSPVLAPATRYLLQQRGAGDFGRDLAGGLAALAVAAAGDRLAAKPTRVSVESAGKAVAALRLAGETETLVALPGSASLLVSPRGMVVWRLAWSATPEDGAIKVERTIEALDAAGAPVEGPVHLGDRVRVSLHLSVDAKVSPVRIEDPYPAGLAPVEQEGEHEPFRMLDESAQRLFWADRVIFLLPSLKAGKTDLVWEATARLAGRFSAAPALVEAGPEKGQSARTPLAIEEAPR